MLRLLADVATPAPDNTTALYALIGVVITALLTAVGGIVVAFLGRKRDAEAQAGLDKSPQDIEFLTKVYADCRTDLEKCQERLKLAEAELDEARSVGEYLLREITGGTHAPKKPPLGNL